MRVFKTRHFARFARGEGLKDAQIAEAIRDAERGLIDADLGGGLIKLRVARAGKGKSGGYRTMIAYRTRKRAVFLLGFAKSRLDNIGDDQLRDLRAAAGSILALSEDEIEERLAENVLLEVTYDDEGE
ncbi:MAG: type II toxin-antitoxin system RelE/ParE family toxin [Alphaproteobacteria bacterium]|nr:type II toxin-antitoxin system RelE/ParE family toxin [Alphaproteobacteria bacterium]